MSNVLEKIAQVAQVSTATVRRAVADDSRVRVETRSRIQKLAHEYGYRPNAFARSLKLGRVDNIGVVMAAPGESDVDIYIRGYASLLRELSFVLESKGRPMMLATASGSLTPGSFKLKLPGIINNGHVNKLVVISHMWTGLAEELNRLRINTVVLDGPPCGLPAVSRDEESVVVDMMDYLVARGHRRIAFLNRSPGGSGTGYRDTVWPRAYLKSVTKHQLVPVAGWDILQSEEEAMNNYISMENPPTAVIAYDDIEASHLVSRYQRRGFRVPEDVSIVALRNDGIAQILHPTITCSMCSWRLMAQKAIEVLGSTKVGGEIVHEAVGSSLFEGESVKSINA